MPEVEEAEDCKVKCAQTLLLAIPTVRDSLVRNMIARLTSLQKRPVADASSRNALSRFETALQKRFPEILESFDEDTFRSEDKEEVSELFGFIDDVYVYSRAFNRAVF